MIETMRKRINEIKQQDRKSYYEIANEIGISESTLYKLISKGELFTPAEQKITAYLKGYLTKDEKLEAYRLENEELKAENDRLKEEIKRYKNV
jgi:transcriptional regulator with XRE-family HTH domain